MNALALRKIYHKTVAEVRTASSFNRTTPTIFNSAVEKSLIQACTAVDCPLNNVKKRDCWTSVGGSQGINPFLPMGL